MFVSKSFFKKKAPIFDVEKDGFSTPNGYIKRPETRSSRSTSSTTATMKIAKALSFVGSAFGIYGKTQNFTAGSEVGNITTAIEHYFGPVLDVDDPTCKQAIDAAGQAPALQQCYPYWEEAKTLEQSGLNTSALTEWLGRFCPSGCNEQFGVIGKDLVSVCRAKPILGFSLSQNQTASLLGKHLDLLTAATCLADNSTGEYCLPVVTASFEGRDSQIQNLTDEQWSETATLITEILCGTNCGYKVS